MIFVSTGGENRRTATKTALHYYDYGINSVELSGGLYSSNFENELLSMPEDIYLQLHNYYPPPEQPFVFNLASIDPDISKLSISHVRQAIRIASLVNRPIYSFHAGFRIDPRVSELGRQLGRHNLLPRDQSLDVFGDRITMLAEEASLEGVTLLVENNVINKKNYESYGEDPLLLTHPDEIHWFMERTPSNVGLLLDVAHLKVSANTRSFDMVRAHEKLKRWIQGYHLSDNDGSADTNHPVAVDSWFWSHIVRGLNYYSLEVYRQSPEFLLTQYKLTDNILSSSNYLQP